MSYIHDENEPETGPQYITLDVTGFYRTMLINTTFYEYSLIMPFNENYNTIVPANLYYLECPLNDDLVSLVPEKDYSVTY